LQRLIALSGALVETPPQISIGTPKSDHLVIERSGHLASQPITPLLPTGFLLTCTRSSRQGHATRSRSRKEGQVGVIGPCKPVFTKLG
jgi:hypothetical protein